MAIWLRYYSKNQGQIYKNNGKEEFVDSNSKCDKFTQFFLMKHSKGGEKLSFSPGLWLSLYCANLTRWLSTSLRSGNLGKYWRISLFWFSMQSFSHEQYGWQNRRWCPASWLCNWREVIVLQLFARNKATLGEFSIISNFFSIPKPWSEKSSQGGQNETNGLWKDIYRKAGPGQQLSVQTHGYQFFGWDLYVAYLSVGDLPHGRLIGMNVLAFAVFRHGEKES